MVKDEFTGGEAVAITIIHSASRTFYIGVDLLNSKCKKYKITVFSDRKRKHYKRHYIEVFSDRNEAISKYELLVNEYLRLVGQECTVKRFGSDKF